MKDVKIERCVDVLSGMRDQRNKCVRRGSTHYLDGLRYSEYIHDILHFLFLCGSIDFGEFRKLEHKFRVSGKDLRKYVYCADFVNDEIYGKVVEVET